MRRQSERARDLFQQSVFGRVEEKPDVRHRDHRQDRRREIGEPQQAASGDLAVDPCRHQQRERNRQRNRSARVPEVVRQRLPEDRIVGECPIVVDADEGAAASGLGRRMEALPQRRGGGVMREKREQRRRRQEHEPAVEPL